MRMLVVSVVSLLSGLAAASAAEPASCDIPDYLLFGSNDLRNASSAEETR